MSPETYVQQVPPLSSQDQVKLRRALLRGELPTDPAGRAAAARMLPLMRKNGLLVLCTALPMSILFTAYAVYAVTARDSQFFKVWLVLGPALVALNLINGLRLRRRAGSGLARLGPVDLAGPSPVQPGSLRHG